MSAAVATTALPLASEARAAANAVLMAWFAEQVKSLKDGSEAKEAPASFEEEETVPDDSEWVEEKAEEIVSEIAGKINEAISYGNVKVRHFVPDGDSMYDDPTACSDPRLCVGGSVIEAVLSRLEAAEYYVEASGGKFSQTGEYGTYIDVWMEKPSCEEEYIPDDVEYAPDDEEDNSA